jgi:hypothetical protein
MMYWEEVFIDLTLKDYMGGHHLSRNIYLVDTITPFLLVCTPNVNYLFS